MHFSDFAPTPTENVGTSFLTTTFQQRWGAPGPQQRESRRGERVTEFLALEATFRLPRVVPNGHEGGRPRGCHATKCA